VQQSAQNRVAAMTEPNTPSSARFAIYFAPDAASALWRFGSSVLGYDADTGLDVPFPDETPFDQPGWPTQTSDPRTYGFHATLRAPFHVRARFAEQDVVHCARGIAASQTEFVLGDLEIAIIKGFIALVPVAAPPALIELEAACVRQCAGLAAPLSDTDRGRRLTATLTQRQRDNLDRYGYPYVFEDFRFHMTLTNRLPPQEAQRVAAQLGRLYAGIAAPVKIGSLSVFHQPHRQARFRIIARLPLAGR